jgi:hypothetical protein
VLDDFLVANRGVWDFPTGERPSSMPHLRRFCDASSEDDADECLRGVEPQRGDGVGLELALRETVVLSSGGVAPAVDREGTPEGESDDGAEAVVTPGASSSGGLPGCSPEELASVLRRFPDHSVEDLLVGYRRLFGAGLPGTLAEVRSLLEVAVQAERHLAGHLGEVGLQVAAGLPPALLASLLPVLSLLEGALRRPVGPSVVVFAEPPTAFGETSAAAASAPPTEPTSDSPVSPSPRPVPDPRDPESVYDLEDISSESDVGDVSDGALDSDFVVISSESGEEPELKNDRVRPYVED